MNMNTDMDTDINTNTDINMNTDMYIDTNTDINTDININKLEEAQNQIPKTLKKQKNVSVDSIAGSGKTRSILKIGYEFPNKNILVLTYNSILRKETQEKLRKENITNIESHTYHSFAGKYIQFSKNDEQLYEAVFNVQSQKLFSYSYIVIDEAQDMNMLHCMLVHKIFKNNINEPNLCFIGDKKQCVYKHISNELLLRSDERFLTHPEKIFEKVNSYKWEHLQLPFSYRVPYKNALFINNCMLHGEQRIQSVKNNDNFPNYKQINIFNKNELYEKIAKDIDNLINYEGYKASDIFILDVSVKSEGRGVKKLENKIVSETNHKAFAPKSDDEEINEQLIENKIVICSFHQSKGRERKIAIIFGFDSFHIHKNLTECPNTLYVATTRASEKLILVQHIRNYHLGFLQTDNIPSYCTSNEPLSFGSESQNVSLSSLKFDVTSLIRHVDQSYIKKCINKLDIKQEKSPNNDLNIQGIYNNEIVADINGVAIPALFQQHIKGGSFPLCELIKKNNNEYYFSEKWIKEHIDSALQLCDNDRKIDIYDALYITSVWMAMMRGYYHTLKQVKKHNWLSLDIINQTTHRLNSIIKNQNEKFKEQNNQNFEKDNELKFEEYYNEKFDKNTYIKGYVDMIDHSYSCVYEIKCTNTLTDEHKLQAAIYKWLTKKDYCFLYNVKTDELISINGDVEAVVDILIENKNQKNEPEIDNELFFNMIHEKQKEIQ